MREISTHIARSKRFDLYPSCKRSRRWSNGGGGDDLDAIGGIDEIRLAGRPRRRILLIDPAVPDLVIAPMSLMLASQNVQSRRRDFELPWSASKRSISPRVVCICATIFSPALPTWPAR